MVNSKITFAKTLRLWLQVLFYSIFGCIIYMGISNEYRLSLVYYALFPVTNNVYWFFTTYILIFLCIPLINNGIRSLKNTALLSLTALFFYCFSLMPTFGNHIFIDNNRIGVFLTLYMMGAWFRLYGLSFISRERTNVISLFISLSFIFLCEWSILTNGWGGDVSSRYRYVWGMEQGLVVVLAFALLVYFSTVKIQSNKIINIIASTVFGVYLIHMNPLTTNYIWFNLLGITNWFDNIMMPLYWVVTGVLIFMICSLIEYLRLMFVDKYTTAIINNSSMVKKVDQFFSKDS